MTAIRPPVFPAVQPHARVQAQKAFFAAAAGKAAPTVESAPTPTVQPVRVEPQGEPAPQKIMRPGSLLDIKV